MSSHTPVVFLAFANAPDDHLDNLKTESREVFRTLKGLADDARIHVHREESSEVDELYEDLLLHDDRIVIFHYGGHANGESLRLEGGDGGAEGLARMLGQQSSLKLVFLNGCATEGHVRHLLANGVPAVIATSVPIGDRKALEFSVAFYRALASGRSLKESFDAGRALVESKHGTATDFVTRSGSEWEDDEYEDFESPVLEWGYFENDAHAEDLAKWRLPDAQAEWTLHLNDANGAVRNVDGEALTIQHIAPVVTVDASVCGNCGAVVEDPGRDHCVICGSSDIASGPARNTAAERFLPFDVVEDDARALVAEIVADGTLIELRPVLVPYWSIRAGVRSEISGERGTVRDFTEEAPKPSWEKVSETIVFPPEDYLVKACSAPVGRDQNSGDWQWRLDASVSVKDIDDEGVSRIALDKPLPDAFAIVAQEIHDDIDAESTERVGGQLQRNLAADIRYTTIEAQSLLLPHWYARVERDGVETGIVINGQSGAARTLHAPGLAHSPDGVDTTMSQRVLGSNQRSKATTSLAASIFAGVGIGLMVGLLLGLSAPSAKSTVGIFIGAVGVALAALLGLNDRHFSTAKGLRIGSFGLAVVLAAPFGIYARDHGLFSPSFGERVDEVVKLGYSKDQAFDLILAAQATAAKTDAASTNAKAIAAAAAPFGSSALYASDAQIGACDTLLSAEPYHIDAPFEQVRKYFADAEPDWGKVADAAAAFSGDDRRNVLLIARDAVCERKEFGPSFRPGKEACAALRIEPGSTTATIPMEFAPLVKRVGTDISPSARAAATQLVASTVCSDE